MEHGDLSTQTTQISAIVSADTRRLMEEYSRQFGVKKGHLVETALLHHLNALHDLPPDVVIPPVLVLTRDSGERVLDRIKNPPPPTDAMRALIDDAD